MSNSLDPTVAEAFVSAINNINFKEVAGTATTTADLTAITNTLKTSLINFVAQWEGINTPAATANLNTFFAGFSQISQTFSTRFNATTGQSFVSQLTTFLGTGPGDDTTLKANLDAAFNTFYTSMLDPSNGGELSQIVPPPTAADLSNQFLNAFTSFAQTYPYASSGGESLNKFMANISSFWGVTAQVLNSDVSGTITLATYENVYNAFIPNPPPPGVVVPSFSDALSIFYNDQVNQQGYFIPSQSFGQWLSYVQGAYSKLMTKTAGNFLTSVTTASSKGVIILDKLLLVLIQMISSLQNVAAAQARRLNILTQWQRAYTDLGNQIHYFIQGTDPLGGTQGEADIRNNMNSANQNYSQTIQANRSTISDDAKALQSNVDQSNTAVNNQSDLGNSILQQLSTILSSIFR